MKWQTVIDYCNNNEGMIGSRQELLRYCENQGFSIIPAKFSTIDCYKNYLIQAGLIHKIKSNGRTLQGKFFIPKKIDHAITIKEVREMAYGETINCCIMGTDQGENSRMYIGDGKWLIEDNTSSPARPKELPDFISENEMEI